MVTITADLAVFAEMVAPSSPISVNFLRFDAGQQRAAIIGYSNDSQHLRAGFREDYSKRSLQSAGDITREL